jgi:hypothetical protein
VVSRRVRGPLGPNGLWKHGQRVPTDGWWIDQHGHAIETLAHRTFPPDGRKGTVTYWRRYEPLLLDA